MKRELTYDERAALTLLAKAVQRHPEKLGVINGQVSRELILVRLMELQYAAAQEKLEAMKATNAFIQANMDGLQDEKAIREGRPTRKQLVDALYGAVVALKNHAPECVAEIAHAEMLLNGERS